MTLHPLCCDCDGCLPGWPAAATPVSLDATRIGPAVMRQELRDDRRAAHEKWKEANPEKARESQRRWRAARKAAA